VNKERKGDRKREDRRRKVPGLIAEWGIGFNPNATVLGGDVEGRKWGGTWGGGGRKEKKRQQRR